MRFRKRFADTLVIGAPQSNLRENERDSGYGWKERKTKETRDGKEHEGRE